MELEITGRHALVTGGSLGIGRQTAATLGRNADATRDYRNAVAIYEKLVGDSPNVPAHRQRLAEYDRALAARERAEADPLEDSEAELEGVSPQTPFIVGRGGCRDQLRDVL